jgi:hypothetical protein
MGYDLRLGTLRGRNRSPLIHTRSAPAFGIGMDGILRERRVNEPRFVNENGTLAYLGEGAATNRALHSRDLTQAAWVKTNCTAAKDVTGADGTANGASRLTATGANATCLQTVTLASSVRKQSAYVRRITGTGVVEMTTNGGSTWTALTFTGDWTPVEIPAVTLANPEFGFRLATSGDVIGVDFVQNEGALRKSSPIVTGATVATRPADILYSPWSTTPPEITAAGGATILVDMVDRGALQVLGTARRIVMTGPGNDAQPDNGLVVAVTAANTLNWSVRVGGEPNAASVTLSTLASQIGDRWRFFLRILVESGQWRLRLDYLTPVGVLVTGSPSSLFDPPSTWDPRLNFLSRGDGENAANASLLRYDDILGSVANVTPATFGY